MKAIKPSIVDEYNTYVSKAGALEEIIISRIDYILNTWFSLYGGKIKYWYFNGANEGEVGDISMDKDTIWNFHLEADPYPDTELIFIDKDGDDYGWQSEIPIRWLYDDNFEQEIIQGKAAYEKREVERKAKKKRAAADKKKLNEKLVSQAKLKLTKEELKALKKAL